MATVPQKDLPNNVGQVLRRAEAGEEITITVAGRPVAQLGPAPRRRWVGGTGSPRFGTRRRPGGWATTWSSSRGPGGPLCSVDARRARHSVLIGAERPGDLEGAISAASIAELHFGVLAAKEEDERARRAQRLGIIEATFDPLPIDVAAAREWGRLSAAISSRGGQPRRRAVDLVIAATANVHHVPLLTRDKDLSLIDDLIDIHWP